jgi:hypothetical protein
MKHNMSKTISEFIREEMFPSIDVDLCRRLRVSMLVRIPTYIHDAWLYEDFLLARILATTSAG